jgi:hypothetical protein
VTNQTVRRLANQHSVLQPTKLHNAVEPLQQFAVDRGFIGGGGVGCECHLDCLHHLPEDSSIHSVRRNIAGTKE